MLHEYLNEKIFMKGISIYLKNHAYGNATTNDLWSALNTARVEEIDGNSSSANSANSANSDSSSSSNSSVTSEVTVSELMSEWILQSGFPVVSVSSPEMNILEIKQTKFCAVTGSSEKNEQSPAEESEKSEENPAEEEKDVLWSIPLNLTGLGGHYQRRHLFRTKVERLHVPVDMLQEVGNAGNDNAGNDAAAGGAGEAAALPQWWLMNTGRVGFFRVNYSDDLLRRLLPHVQSSMAPADRLGLISDVIALSAAGIANVSSVMLLLSSYGAGMKLCVSLCFIGNSFFFFDLFCWSFFWI